MKVKNIFAETNRGLLLDVVVFVLNIILMRRLTAYFIELVRAPTDDRPARFALGLFFLGTFVLPAAGAVLKRWHFHRRGGLRRKGRGEDNVLSGCLFHPLIYFLVSFCFSLVAAGIFGEQIFGQDFHQNGAIFFPLLLSLLALSLTQTVLVYRYFSPPKKAPADAFRRDPRSELAGDACIYLNMILFQILLNLIISVPFSRVTSFEEFAGRGFWLCLIAFVLYFPPRLFYLAEDINRPTTWLTMLLANSPTILRVLFGVNQNVAG